MNRECEHNSARPEEAANAHSICEQLEGLWENENDVDLIHFVRNLEQQLDDTTLLELIRIDLDNRNSRRQGVNRSVYTTLLPGKSDLIHNLVCLNSPTETMRPAELNFKVLGNYELLRLLGSGGMAEVYLARHRMLEGKNRLAVKIIRSDKLNSVGAQQRFLREIKILGQLGKHSNIVTAHDAGEHEGTLYIVMDFVEGIDCQKLIKGHANRIPIADACEIVRQAGSALQFAHDKGIIHRDVKPANLMLSKDGTVKLLDLGLARFRFYDDGLSVDGNALGTFHYMAPEQIENPTAVTGAADVYSLGCSLYCLLTGRPPFGHGSQKSRLSIICSHVSEKPIEVRTIRQGVPKELATILTMALEKSPAQRIATPGVLAESLKPFCVSHNLPLLLDEVPVTKVPEAEKENETEAGELTTDKWRSFSVIPQRVSRTAAVFGLLALVLLASFWMLTNPPEPISARIFAHRLVLLESGNFERQGLINVDPHDGEFNYTDEYVRFEFGLNRPLYNLVIAFTPGDSPMEVIWPSNPTDELEKHDAILIPDSSDDSIRLPMAEKTQVGRIPAGKRWSLNDGVGLHLYLIVSSDSPLPTVDNVSQNLANVEWNPRNVGPTRWWVQNGVAYVAEFSSSLNRDAEELSSDNLILLECSGSITRSWTAEDVSQFDMQRFVNEIQKLFPGATINGVAFPVHEFQNDNE